MGLAMAGIGLIGSVMGAAGQAKQAQATSASDQYQAQVARNNAIIAQQNASDEMIAGNTAAMNSGLQSRAKIGDMVSSQGANGIETNSGSAAAVRAGADQTSLLDALTIRQQSARRAYGYEVQSTSDTAQAGLDDMAAKNAQEAGSLGVASSLISGASSVGKVFSTSQSTFGGFGGLNLGIG